MLESPRLQVSSSDNRLSFLREISFPYPWIHGTMEPPAPPSQKASFPTLEVLDPSKPHVFIKPTKCINEGPDVEKFLVSKAYRDIGMFVMQVNRAMCPRKVVGLGPSRRETARTWSLDTLSEASLPDSVKRLRALLKRVEALVEEAPPDPGPRRFGNVSFRKWHQLIQERADDLMDEFIDKSVLEFPSASGKDGEGFSPRDELRAYFLGGFGSEQRLDYGTGHELSFFAFLACLWKLGAFKDGKEGGDIERSLVLGVFEP